MRKNSEVAKRFADESLLRLLLRAGVKSKNAAEIADKQSLHAVKGRPYILVHDLYFLTVDKVARNVLSEQFSEFSEERVPGAINWLLRKAAHDGNCGVSFITLRNILQRDFALRRT
jgi:Helix-hairpin-helix containing domain